MVSFRLLPIPVCMLATATAVHAQESLTLADATARALAKNHAIRIERESIAGADARMSGARGDYDPQLRWDLTARHLSLYTVGIIGLAVVRFKKTAE